MRKVSVEGFPSIRTMPCSAWRSLCHSWGGQGYQHGGQASKESMHLLAVVEHGGQCVEESRQLPTVGGGAAQIRQHRGENMPTRGAQGELVQGLRKTIHPRKPA